MEKEQYVYVVYICDYNPTRESDIIVGVYYDLKKAKEKISQLADDYVSKNGGDIGYGAKFIEIFGRKKYAERPPLFKIEATTIV